MTTGMINPARLRASLRRLFSNDWNEIIGELLQNAQRAGATEVAFTTTEAGFRVADNGHGLQGGIAGIATLLSLGDSAFDNPAVADQAPMGLGIHALLAAEGVAAVCFRSGSYATAIDTARWWTDMDYVERWQAQVQSLAQPVTGMQLDVTCSPNVVAALTKELTGASYRRSDRTRAQEGYADLLSITLDGVALATATPAWVLPQPILTTSYQGCPLTIGTSHQTARSAVNWYGQIILVQSPISFYLHVRSGRPVNPLAPSRRGLIRDAALAALEQFVADALFTFLATEPVETLQPAWIALAWAADRERARQLPVCVVAPLQCIPHDEPIWSVDELNQVGDQQIVRIDAVPLLLDEAVQVATATLPAEALAGGWFPPTQVTQRGPWQLADYGRDAFLPLLHASGRIPYSLIHGDATRLPIQRMWWLPGPARADVFNARGTWGLGTRETPPAVCEPVTADVWAFNASSTTDATEVDWAVGTSDPLDFLGGRVWAGYGPDQESEMSCDEQERSYRESVADWMRGLIGDCVSSTFSPADLRRLMPTPTSPLHRLTFQYSAAVNAPTGVLVENAAGEQKIVRFLD